MSDPTDGERVPHHGGRPAEMLRDLADFLDTIDRFFDSTRISGGKHDGKTFGEVLRGKNENRQTMQADVRWLAERLDGNGGAPDPSTPSPWRTDDR